MSKMMEKEAIGMAYDLRIRKVKVLQGRLREDAESKGLACEDLVLVTTKAGSLPEYSIEKIEGDPVSFLLKRAGKT
jgi:hypothetical protein